MTVSLHVRSSTAAGITLHATRAGVQIEVTISRKAIEQAFQLTESTEGDRQDLVEANLDEIGRLVAARTLIGGTKPIALDASDLESLSMHLTGDVAKKAAD